MSTYKEKDNALEDLNEFWEGFVFQEMTVKEAAEMLNGRQYLSEISVDEKEILRQNRLVAVFGQSDDLVVFEGAVEDDFDCFGGSEVYVNEQGVYVDVEDTEDYRKIVTKWAEEGYSWSYETDIPHETFEIFEDDSKYCKGIVFSLNDLQNKKSQADKLAVLLDKLEKIELSQGENKCREYAEKAQIIEAIQNLLNDMLKGELGEGFEIKITKK
ncbi:MAG: hypothetical protein LBM93_09255 [Oscillospiraceae bacterium]|jgi:hypothetical protein|nr:hypothetical protein [Oscillospiraceae bacterium]